MQLNLRKTKISTKTKNIIKNNIIGIIISHIILLDRVNIIIKNTIIIKRVSINLIGTKL